MVAPFSPFQSTQRRDGDVYGGLRDVYDVFTHPPLQCHYKHQHKENHNCYGQPQDISKTGKRKVQMC